MYLPSHYLASSLLGNLLPFCVKIIHMQHHLVLTIIIYNLSTLFII